MTISAIDVLTEEQRLSRHLNSKDIKIKKMLICVKKYKNHEEKKPADMPQPSPTDTAAML